MIVAIAIAAVIGAAIVVYFVTDHNDDGTFAVTYYKDGHKVLETRVPPGTFSVVHGDMGESKSLGRFVGWNTKTDMTGTTMMPGSQIKVNRNISLFATMADNGLFMVVLPGEQNGYTLTADPLYAVMGGSSIVTYTPLPSHTEENMVIYVNGNPVKLDAMKRIHLSNITKDQFITVTSVFDKSEHSISLPKEQKGYILTSSAEKVHNGESYTLEFTLLPGYTQTGVFGIHLNGGDARVPKGGTLLIENVIDDHLITVTGVELTEYSVVLGKNISALVNGAPSSRATVEDVLTILPDKGYNMPDNFDTQIKGTFTPYKGGYRISSNITFPSILKITAGDNIIVNGRSSGTAFVCSGDVVRITPSSGHQLPDDYTDAVKKLKGVKYSAEGFSFSDDTELPSIYSVTFNGYNKIHATFYVIGGDECPYPKTSPLRDFYHFEGWNTDPKNILKDTDVFAIWGANEYNITVVDIIHCSVSINNIHCDTPRRYIVTVEDTITVEAIAPYELPYGYLPANVFIKKDNGYSVVSDYILGGIFYVEYKDSVTNLLKRYYYSELEVHTIVNPKSQVNPLFTFDLNKTGYDITDFIGWVYNGSLYEESTIIVSGNISLVSLWKPK